jgi:hypothetical protein
MEPQTIEQPCSQEPIASVEYTPTKQEALRQYEIRIEFLSRGCIVRVGCKSIPFESVDAAMKCLSEYVKDPITKEKEWVKILN